MDILFVCTGNTCRSPMAEAIFNHLHTEAAFARSAGLAAFEGSRAAGNTLKVLDENKIRKNHRARQVGEQDVLAADYIFTMTQGHKVMLMDLYPAAADKIFTLKEFVNGKGSDPDIRDPFGGDVAVYRDTFRELEELILRLNKMLE